MSRTPLGPQIEFKLLPPGMWQCFHLFQNLLLLQEIVNSHQLIYNWVYLLLFCSLQSFSAQKAVHVRKLRDHWWCNLTDYDKHMALSCGSFFSVISQTTQYGYCQLQIPLLQNSHSESNYSLIPWKLRLVLLQWNAQAI